jgi:hypothetical protein
MTRLGEGSRKASLMDARLFADQANLHGRNGFARELPAATGG